MQENQNREPLGKTCPPPHRRSALRLSGPAHLVNGRTNDIRSELHKQTHIFCTTGRQSVAQSDFTQPIVRNGVICSYFLPFLFLSPLMNSSSVSANNRDRRKERAHNSAAILTSFNREEWGLMTLADETRRVGGKQRERERTSGREMWRFCATVKQI